MVLYFYPKDDIPGCTTQAYTFREAYTEFLKHKITVMGISRDNAASHQKIAPKYRLPFILLANTDGVVIAALVLEVQSEQRVQLT